MDKVKALLDNIKFEHTIFALPFAYLGMVLASKGLPTFWQFLWVTMAMAGARTLAMSTNRLIDFRQDVLNPRTANRPLPKGLLSRKAVVLLCVISFAVVLFSAWQLNPLCVALFPLAMIILIGYSFTKRFTWFTHAFLGIADGGAPLGGWIAITGQLGWEPVVLAFAVATWVGGFDLIYACQDIEFDRKHGVHSVAARFGVKAALEWSIIAHAITILLLILLGVMMSLGLLYWLGLAVATLLLTYEHSLVRADDLSRLNVAFFNMNGYIAVIVFAFTFAGLYL